MALKTVFVCLFVCLFACDCLSINILDSQLENLCIIMVHASLLYNYITGTAVSGFDYNVVTNITIPADSSGEHCANISIIEDTLFEGDETFTLALIFTPTFGVAITLDNDMVAITITETESKGRTV